MVEVRVENVRKTYGKVEALKGASLNFKSGALTAILGPSGCGKTTLLRSIAGFIPIDEGRIFFGGDDVTELPPQQRGTAMVFQNYALWPHMTIFGNVAYGLQAPEGARCRDPQARPQGAGARRDREPFRRGDAEALRA